MKKDKVLIIYAHPNKKGYSGEYLRLVEEKLQEEKKDYEIIDLYKINYDPNLKDSEHYTSGGYEVSMQNKEFQEKISFSSKMIFIYPIWWQNMPAILKGFLDRVFVARYAFRFKRIFTIGHFTLNYPIKLLKGKKAIVLTSSGGPRLYSRFIVGDKGIKALTKDTLEFCGIKARGYGVGDATTFDERGKRRVHKVVNRALRYLL